MALTGCGSAQKNEAKETTATPPVAAVTHRDLSPAEAPAGLFLRGRVHDPAALTESLATALRLPLDVSWLQNELPEPLRQSVDSRTPVEVAVALDPGQSRIPLWAVSFGAPSVEQVLSELDRQGVVADEAPQGLHTFSVERNACAVGRALGPAPARVVCSRSPAGLDLLGAFALRGLPTQELSDAAVHLELTALPLQSTYGQQLGAVKLLSSALIRQVQIDHPRFDRALADGAFGLIDEVIALSQDVENLKLQLWQEGDDYELSLSGRFPGARAWSLQALRELKLQQAPPPAVFWQLPATTSAASFGLSVSRAQTRPLWAVLSDGLVGYLESEGLGAATSERLTRWFEGVSELKLPSVSGRGPLVLRSQPPRGAEPAWHLWAIEADAAPYRKKLDELVGILKAPELERIAKSTRWLPKLTSRGGLGGRAGSAVFEWEGVPGAVFEQLSDLPLLWTALPSSLKPLPGGKSAETARGFLALVPQGELTWFGAAESLDELKQLFSQLERPETPRLARNAGLSSLENDKVVLGGFLKVESLASWGPESKSRQDWAEVSGKLPHRGEVPLTFALRVDGTEALDVKLNQRIPRPFVTDAAVAFGPDPKASQD